LKKHRIIPWWLKAALFCYSFIWLAFRLGSKLLIPFHPDIRRQSRNRYYSASKLQSIHQHRSQFEKCILFYCSSAGEYEQAKPLIDRLKATHFVYILFFSASGYEYANQLEEEAGFGMTPIDTVWDWKRMLKSLSPSMAIIVRHEFWPGFILTNYQYSSTIAIDVFIKEETSRLSMRFKNFLFGYLDQVYTVTERDLQRLNDQNLNRASVAGNTKFDRARERLASRVGIKKQIAHTLNSYFSQERRLIVGSAWKEDVLIALDALQKFLQEEHPPINLILVPHDVSASMIKWIQEECEKRQLLFAIYSKDQMPSAHVRVMIVDVVGYLFEMYTCSDWAMIGGGFQQGIHNVVEAAVAGIPMVSGPMIEQDPEAMAFSKHNLLSIVKDAQALFHWLKAKKEPDEALQIKLNAQIQTDSGSSDYILTSIKHHL